MPVRFPGEGEDTTLWKKIFTRLDRKYLIFTRNISSITKYCLPLSITANCLLSFSVSSLICRRCNPFVLMEIGHYNKQTSEDNLQIIKRSRILQETQGLPEAEVQKELLWNEQLNTSLTVLYAVQSEWLNISNTIETVVLWINVTFNKRRR